MTVKSWLCGWRVDGTEVSRPGMVRDTQLFQRGERGIKWLWLQKLCRYCDPDMSDLLGCWVLDPVGDDADSFLLHAEVPVIVKAFTGIARRV